MNIIVCVKQVPMNNNAKVDPITGVMIRSSSDTKLNPFDLFALETALLIKKPSDTLTAITMGPPNAKLALNECIYMGADKGVLISDRAFAGSDVLATSYTLAQALKTLKPDLILCGKQTTDGDTAQVGAEISSQLNMPCVCYVDKVIDVNDTTATVEMNLNEVNMTVKVTLPALISVEKDIFTPRLPSLKRQMDLGETDIKVLTLNDLPDTSPDHYGLKGSPTQVERIFPPEKSIERKQFDQTNAIDGIYQILKEKKYV